MNREKQFGQYFTPDYIADFMLNLSNSTKDSKVLEPACGEGVFLEALENKGYKNITAYEIDDTLNISSDKAEIYFRSFISESFNKKFSLIIGNPPYIRWKNLDDKLKHELEDNKLWNKYFNSLCDYLYVFILKSVELLEEGGELIFITPEYWINTKHSQTLRDYLVDNGYFTDIIHFNEAPIFDKVASSIVIFKYIKTKDKKRNNINVIKYLSSKKPNNQIMNKMKSKEADNDLDFFECPQFKSGDYWVIAPEDRQKELEKFEGKCLPVKNNKLFNSNEDYVRLGDISDIGNGMVSGLDKAFQLPEDIELNEEEKKLTIDVIKAKNLNRYNHNHVTKYIFLNDHTINEQELEQKYPNFYNHLVGFREQLKKRYNYNRDIKFWEWVFLRNYVLFKKPKSRIFVPCKERISHKDFVRFSIAPKNVFPTQDVTAIFLKDEVKESIYYILAILNNELVFNWLKLKGVIKGNIVEFSEKPLASIPIRLIDWSSDKEVIIHDDIVDLVKDYISNEDSSILDDINKKILELF